MWARTPQLRSRGPPPVNTAVGTVIVGITFVRRSYLLPAAVGVPNKQFDVVVVAAAAAVTAAVLAIVGIRIVVGELARDGGEPAC